MKLYISEVDIYEFRHFGQSFKEKREIKDFLKDYNRKNFSNLVIASINSKQIVIACRLCVTRNT